MITTTSARTFGAACLIAVGALGLAACGSDNTSSGSSATTPAAGGSSSTSSGGITCATGSLTSSGSTAQANAMSAWIAAYQEACKGSAINYQGGGSAKGVTDFTAATDDFAGSDYPLNSTNKPAADTRCKGSAIDLPMTPGAIAIGYNLKGISNLKLSASTLAGIFGGKITKWNDPAITKDNPGVTLPSISISTFHRSDGSGTSFNFSNYLTNDAKSAWTFGANKQWPSAAGGQGEKGSSLVASSVEKTAGGIGYFEDSYATADNIQVAEIGDSAGNFVTLSNTNTTNFLSHATVTGTGGDLALSFDYTSASTSEYPNVLVTYEIVCATGNKSPALLKGFLGYTAGSGQSILPANGYVTLPTAISSKVTAAVAGLS